MLNRTNTLETLVKLDCFAHKTTIEEIESIAYKIDMENRRMDARDINKLTDLEKIEIFTKTKWIINTDPMFENDIIFGKVILNNCEYGITVDKGTILNIINTGLRLGS